MTAWEEYAKGVEKQRNAIGSLWTLYDGSKLPLPGDIYLLTVVFATERLKVGDFRHVGIVIDDSGSNWTTADSGQGNGNAMSYITRYSKADTGRIKGEHGDEAGLKGWVSLFNLLPGWKPKTK
jgi:hypothetical protein